MPSPEESRNNETNNAESNEVATGKSGTSAAGPSQVVSAVSKAEMGELLQGSECHALEMNVWDAALLVGTRIYLPEEEQPIYLDCWQVMNIVFLFIINVLMQAGFVVASAVAYADERMLNRDGIFEAILHQRFYTHHEYARVDWVTQKTEIRSLCDGLHVSQLSILADDTKLYLENSTFGGGMIALLACLIWTISIWVEIRQCLTSFVSLIMIGSEAEEQLSQAAAIQIGQPVEVLYEKEWYKAKVKAFPAHDPEGRGRWTVECESDPPGTLTYSADVRQIDGTAAVTPNTRFRKSQIKMGGIQSSFVKDMSKRHKALLLTLVTLPRLIIGVALYVVGVRFLADTLEVGEIILNTCALEIVKQIDDILFMALASRGLQKVVSFCLLKSRDIDVKKLGVKKWYWTGWIGQCILIVAAMVIVWLALLVDYKDEVETAEANICKNDIDFAYIEHPLSGMPVFVNVKTDESGTFENISLSIAGSPQESLQCYYRAKDELFKLKYNVDDTSTSSNLVKSRDPACQSNGPQQFQCGTLPLEQVRTLSMMTSVEVINGVEWCVNQDTHLHLLRETCMVDSRLNKKMRELFERKEYCSDWTEVCLCPELTKDCDLHEFQRCNVTQKYGIDTVWIEVIRDICPCSCGRCDNPCQEYMVYGEMNFSRTFDRYGAELERMTGSGTTCAVNSLADPRGDASSGSGEQSNAGGQTNSPPMQVNGTQPRRRLASLSEAARARRAAEREAVGQVKATARTASPRRLEHSEVKTAKLARRAAQQEHRASTEAESEAAAQQQELRQLTAENEALAQRVAELEQRPTRNEFEELRQNLADIRQILKNALPSHAW